jgi:hypothetical protein
MANLATSMQKSLLDWMLKGATPVSPAGVFVGLSLVAPTSAASSEVGTGSGYTRQSGSFAAAVTTTGNVGSASNSLAMTFGPFSSSCVINGLFLADTVSSAAGTGLLFGNLATVRTPLAGDSLVLAIGALAVTIS